MTITAPPAVAAVPPTDDLERLAERVDRAIAAIESLAPDARETAATVKTAIESFHKAGLTAIVKRLKADSRGKELLFELVDDPAVHALLTLHGIVRAPLPPEATAPLEPIDLVQIQLPRRHAAEASWAGPP